jgi:hypothetical protein
MMRAALLAAAVAGSVALVPGAASAQALVSISAPISVSVPGPVGGSQTCVSPGVGCITLQGVSDLKVTATVNINGLVAPLVTLSKVPGCTAAINTQATLHPVGLGSASVNVTISYNTTDPNGGATSSHTVTKTVTLAPGGPPVTVSECASLP